jgi:hypothetical protein
VEWYLKKERNLLEKKNPSICHFVQHKLTYTALGSNPHLSGKKLLTNHQTNGLNKACVGLCKQKGEVHAVTDHEGPDGEYRNSSTLSLTSVLYWFGWSVTRPGRFTPGKEIGGWVGPSVGLDRCGKYTTGRRSPDPPAHTESLYRLSYPGPLGWYVAIMLTDTTVEYWHWTFNRSHANTVPAADRCYRGTCQTLHSINPWKCKRSGHSTYYNLKCIQEDGATRWHSATSRKVADSILLGSLKFFIDLNLPGSLGPWGRLRL